MTDINLEKCIEILKQSVDLLYENDLYLIDNNIHEQDISYKIAHYFENLLNSYKWFQNSNLNIDVEYNKNISNFKRIQCQENCHKENCYLKNTNNEIENETCRPDIILHERGTRKNNILVIEIKKNNGKNKKDFSKLSAYTCQEFDYKYKLGIYINIKKNDKDFTFFQEGKPVKENKNK